jgi:hypothetical protein
MLKIICLHQKWKGRIRVIFKKIKVDKLGNT